MWILLYRILYLPAFLVALPYYGIRMLKRGGYGKDLSQRIGNFPQLPEKEVQRPRIWLQAVSVGEVLSVGALIRELKTHLGAEIILTTTTSTGYAEACKRYKQECIAVGLFPLDFVWFSRRTWKRIDPDIVITMESELWPEHLHEAKRRDVPIYVINTRLSDRSFGRYKRIHYLANRLLGKPRLFFPASGVDSERLQQLGVNSRRIHCMGNIKVDVAARTEITERDRHALRTKLGFIASEEKNEPLVLLGASTWPGEEAMLIDILQTSKKCGMDCRLLIVPRHAERSNEIVRLLASHPFSYHIRSRDGEETQSSIDIHLADTTGELSYLAQAADLAFIGKSLPPNRGGQTPIETVSLGLPTVMGPHMENFRAIVRSQLTVGAAIQTLTTESTREALLMLLNEPREREALIQASRKWLHEQTGVSEKIALHLAGDYREIMDAKNHRGL
jgi:3-deoxy-D-manno-octulosonic-acid transferase